MLQRESKFGACSPYGLLAICMLLCLVVVSWAKLEISRDEEIYEILWLEADEKGATTPNSSQFHGPLPMRSSNNESYSCFVPIFGVSDGPSEEPVLAMSWDTSVDRLKPLVDKKICMARVEGYWIYELCHGYKLRQFHQEISNRQQLVVTKEFILGRYPEGAFSVSPGEASTASKLPVLVWEGTDLPYFEVVLTEGTPCDLRNGEPRTAVVRHICLDDAPDSLLQIRESATCEYEVIVAIQALCSLTEFTIKKAMARKIHCFSDSPSYITPHNVMKMQEEVRMSRKGLLFTPRASLKRQNAVQQDESDVENDDEEEDEQSSQSSKQPSSGETGTVISSQPAKYSPDDQEVLDDLIDFLDGKFCVHGGSGYWKHSFCFGKTIIQYHEEGSVLKNENVITLGVWDSVAHKAWIQKNPQKKPSKKIEVRSFTNYYENGDVCDLIGGPRSVEVKLKCLRDSERSPSAVALYLVEPKPCAYVLGVESAMFCHAMPYVDDNGLIDNEAMRKALSSQ